MTRQVAVSVTVSGVEPHDAKLEGVAARLTLPVLALAVKEMFGVAGLHVRESVTLPCRLVDANVIVTGLELHPAFGALLSANPTA